MTSRPFLPILAAVVLAVAVLAGCSGASFVGSMAAPTVAVSEPPATPTAEVETPSTVPTAGAVVSPTSTSVPTPTAQSPATEPPTSASTAASQYSGTAAYELDRAIAGEIGSRPGGSPEFVRAADFIKQQLEGMGYEVTLQPYQAVSFRERSTRLTVARPQLLQIAAGALAYSGTADVEGDLVYCGLGGPADFPEGSLKGKVALMDRGQIPFQTKVDAATAKGAAAVVISNDRDGELHGSLSRPANIPVVGILQSDGKRLRQVVEQGKTTVRVAVDASTVTRDGQNVVGAAPGARPDEQTVVLGAHYDSVAAGPGANDNGSGVATILELARETRDRAFPFDLTFVAFGDEEIGLVGSRKYVESLSSQARSRVIAMLNFDMVGVGTAMEFDGDKSLAAEATRNAQSLGVKTQPSTLQSNQTSDHASFLDAGIPAIFFYRAEDANYHTSRDTVDRVEPHNLGEAGAVALRLLDQLGRR